MLYDDDQSSLESDFIDDTATLIPIIHHQLERIYLNIPNEQCLDKNRLNFECVSKIIGWLCDMEHVFSHLFNTVAYDLLDYFILSEFFYLNSLVPLTKSIARG